MESTIKKSDKHSGKTVFSPKLFRETMRTLRVMALIFLAISVIVIAITTISKYATWQSYKTRALEYGSGSEEYVSLMQRYETFVPYGTVGSLSWFLTVYMYIAGIMLPFAAFSFLNTRKGSDFYHAIPFTRTGLFASTFLACFAWEAITVVASVVLSMLGCLVTGMTFSYSLLIPAVVSNLIGVLLMSAISSLAMSVTGTRFSNIILVGLVLFLPRFILAICNLCVQSIAHIVPVQALSFVLDASYNTPVGILLATFDATMGSAFSGLTAEAIMGAWQSWLYTFVLAVIYIGVAILAFKKRKSETAATSANSKFLQAVYRCAIALPPLLYLGCWAVCDSLPELGYTLVFIAMSVIAYFLFELITTKSAKKMLKCAPVYLVVVAITFAVIAGSVFTAKALLNTHVNSERVASVTVIQKNRRSDYDTVSYNELLQENYSFTDSEYIALCAKCLDSTIEGINSETNGEAISGDLLTLSFNYKDGGHLLRSVLFRQGELNRITAIMAKDQEYVSAQTRLPADSEIRSCVWKCGNTTFVDNDAIFDCFRKEFEALSYEQRLTVMGANYNAMVTLSVTGYYNGQIFDSVYAIDPAEMPETISLAIKESNAQASKSLDENWDNLLKATDAAKISAQDAAKYEYIGSDGLVSIAFYNTKAVNDALANANSMTKFVEAVSQIRADANFSSYYESDYMPYDPYRNNTVIVPWLTEYLVPTLRKAPLSNAYDANGYMVCVSVSYSYNSVEKSDAGTTGSSDGRSFSYFLTLSQEEFNALVLQAATNMQMYEAGFADVDKIVYAD